MGIGAFLTSADNDLAPVRTYKTELSQSLGAYFALGLVDASVGLRLGETFDAVVQTGATIVGTIKDLCLTDQAYFFGSGQIDGQEADPSWTQEVDTFGFAAGPKLTDTMTATVVWKLAEAYSARQFLNMLAKGREFDLFMFTNNTVEAVYAGEHGVVYSAPGNSKSNRDAKISGGFTHMYKSTDGFLIPEVGVSKASLTNDVKFVFGTTTLVAAVAATCSMAGRKKYTIANATAGSLTFVLDPVNLCVDWYCTNADGSDLPATGKGSFDSLAAKLTIPNDLAPGKYVYKVFAVNATGIKGEQLIELVVAAA